MIYSYFIILSSLLRIFFTIEIVDYQKCLDFENDNWKAFDLITSVSMNNICSGDITQIEFGGPSYFDYSTVLFKIFLNLPAHENLSIQFTIKCVNQNIFFGYYYYTYDYNFYLFIDDIQYIVSCDSTNDIQRVVQSHKSVSITLALETVDIYPDWWSIQDFKLQLNEKKGYLDPMIFGEIFDIIELNILSNDGWFDEYQSYKIQNIIEFSLLGTDYMATFILQKQFLLPFIVYEIEIQFKIFSYYCYSISMDIILNSEIFTLNRFCTYLKFDSLYIAVINLKVIIINPVNFLNIAIQNSQGISIIGIRDFQLFYKKYEGNIIPQCLNQINGKCWNCLEGWNLINELNFCIPTCGDMIITYNEECDDGNNIPFDGCYNCRFQCDLKCKKCLFGKCQDLANKKTNIEIDIGNCKIDSYYSDSGIYYDLNYQACLAICGDGIVALNEQCDDRNDILYDGCHFCQFQCPLHCLNCNNGICVQCIQGYQLNKNQCESFCGDQIINENEQCDDGNQIQQDGCYNCQFNCKYGCLNCINNSYCIKCLDGWNNNNGQCEQLCNDNKLAILSIEQCDDSSDYYCMNCQIQCSIDNCVLCQAKFSCLQCEKPYSLINGQCVPYCGDGMIYQITEQCDDGNNIQHDGCYNCQFECLDGCQKCDLNLYCTLCDSDNYVLSKGKCLQNEFPNKVEEESEEEASIACARNELLINFECVNQCGNGVIDNEFEVCDDGNRKGGDGCSFDCQIEKFYICKSNDNQMSQCTYIPQPQIILTTLSAKRSALQIVQITFSEEVKSNQQYLIENIMQLTIIPNIETIITIKPITNISLTPSNASYLIEIQFQQQVEHPQLKVQILKEIIYSKQGQEIQELNNQISLGEPFILSKKIQLKVDQITEVNNSIIYSMAGIAIFAVLTGNFALLLNLLDLLQQLSYLRYMQYQFPSHLKQFLDSYTKISLKPLFDKLQIDQLIANLNGGNIPFIGKYKNTNQNTEVNQLNQYFLLNAKSCYLSLIISYGTYKLCSFIVSDKVQLFITNKILLKANQSKQQLSRIYLVNQYVREKCYSIKKYYFFVGISQSYFANMHQLLFSSFLQFPNYIFDSWLNVCNSINAIFSLGLITQVTFITFSLPNDLNKKILKYQFLFKDVNKNYWSLYSKSFQMFKSLFYIFIVVFCINYPEVQSFLLSVESALYLSYLLKYLLLYYKQLDHLKLILRETMLLLITGSFSAYSFQLTHDQLLLFGWIHISMILIIMIGSIMLDFIKQISECYITYQKGLRDKELKLQALYRNNLLQKFVREEGSGFYFQR